MEEKALVAYSHNDPFDPTRSFIDFYPEFCCCPLYLYAFLNYRQQKNYDFVF